MFVSIEEGRQLIIDAVAPVETEQIPLGKAYGRVLAMDIVAKDDVPSFDRSPFDGYAFRAEDTKDAAKKWSQVRNKEYFPPLYDQIIDLIKLPYSNTDIDVILGSKVENN